MDQDDSEALLFSSSHSKSLRRKSDRPFFARSFGVTRWLQRLHLPRGKFRRLALHYTLRIDRRSMRPKEREANSVLHSRESHRCSRTLSDGVRLDTAQFPFQNGKGHEDPVYWVNLKVVERKGLTFNQTRSHEIILYNTSSFLHRKSGDQEDGRSVKQSSVQVALFTAQKHTETSLDRMTNWYFKLGSERINRRVSKRRRTCHGKVWMFNVWTRTGRSVAQVKVVPRLTSEFRVYCTRQRNDKTPRAKKCLRNWFVRSKRTQTERRWKPIFSKIKRTIQPANSRRTWSTAWGTWSTSRCARSLPKSSALSVWRIARKGSCAADADSAYIRPIKRGN